MKIVQVNYAFDDRIDDPEALLDAYETLTGWSEAVAAAGATMTVVQAFHRDAVLLRNGIKYVFSAGRSATRGRTTARVRWPHALQASVAAADPDIVHVNSLEFFIESWQLRRALPQSTAILMQDHAGGVPGPLTRPVRRRLMKAVDGFLFTATPQATPWQQAGLISPDQTVYQVLESSTTLRPIDRDAARALAGVEGDPAVLWVGRLNATKDPLTVLSAFEKALESLPDAVLTMVYGTDELLSIVRDRLSQSGPLARGVRLVGHVPHSQLAAFYSASDVFVLGSLHEGSGYALLEACACGTLPVVTDIPSFRAITGKGSIGALWPPGDVSACAHALIDTARRDRAGSRHQVTSRFEHHLSWPAVARTAVAAYEDARAQRRTRGRDR